MADDLETMAMGHRPAGLMRQAKRLISSHLQAMGSATSSGACKTRSCCPNPRRGGGRSASGSLPRAAMF